METNPFSVVLCKTLDLYLNLDLYIIYIIQHMAFTFTAAEHQQCNVHQTQHTERELVRFFSAVTKSTKRVYILH